MLQGNATTFGASGNAALGRPGFPTVAPRMNVPGRVTGNARLDAEADQVLMRAQTNVTVPPQVFKGWLDRSHPQFNLNAQSMPASDVLEIKGAWDDANKTLTALGIKHETAKARALTESNLSRVKVLVVNCEGKVPREAFQMIRTGSLVAATS